MHRLLVEGESDMKATLLFASFLVLIPALWAEGGAAADADPAVAALAG
jgi:hypothetical protein